MSYDFVSDIPIYLQIIDAIKMDIINKKYLPGYKIPSVREMSLIFEVNPNTIQKALGELEEIGLIITERTNGKFVTKDKSIIEKIRKDTINKMIDEFYFSMEKVGLSKREVLDILNREELWRY